MQEAKKNKTLSHIKQVSTITHTWAEQNPARTLASPGCHTPLRTCRPVCPEVRTTAPETPLLVCSSPVWTEFAGLHFPANPHNYIL